jgi:hypothetical protein
MKKSNSKEGVCLICNGNRVIITDCDNHKICEGCLKYPRENLKRAVEGCRNCDNYLSIHCANCFCRLVNSEKPRLNCEYNHVYCFKCFSSNDLRNKLNCCLQCKDDLNRINNDTSDKSNQNEGNQTKISPNEKYQDTRFTPKKNEGNQTKISSNEKYQDNSYFETPQISQKFTGIFSNTKFCPLCNSNETMLHCGHPKCLNKLLQVFQNSIISFAQTLKTRNFSILENDLYSIRCYEPYCNNLYCYPVFMFFKEGVKLFESIFPGRGELHMNHYEAFFEGSKYKFFICDNCESFIGLTNFNACCLYCQKLFSIKD